MYTTLAPLWLIRLCQLLDIILGNVDDSETHTPAYPAQQIEREAGRVAAIIRSCRTQQQAYNCRILIANFQRKYGATDVGDKCTETLIQSLMQQEGEIGDKELGN